MSQIPSVLAAFLLGFFFSLQFVGFSGFIDDTISNGYSLSILIGTFFFEVIMVLVTILDRYFDTGGTSRTNCHSGASQGPEETADAQVADERAEV